MSNELVFNDPTVNLIGVMADVMKSRTQSIKVVAIEKDNKPYVSCQKWWRKDPEQPWLEGKGFHLSEEEAKSVVEGLQKSLNEFGK
ncbi:hypothetical protein [Bacillus phage YungSlug]|nr:hypothetical protein [Bacillus phage YungSlug]